MSWSTLTSDCSIFDYLSTLKACNSQYIQYYFRRVYVLYFLDIIFLFLIKRSALKAIEIEIAFFHSLGNLKGHRVDYFFCA